MSNFESNLFVSIYYSMSSILLMQLLRSWVFMGLHVTSIDEIPPGFIHCYPIKLINNQDHGAVQSILPL